MLMMAKTTRIQEETAISGKENSPPCLENVSMGVSSGLGLKILPHSNTLEQQHIHRKDNQFVQLTETKGQSTGEGLPANDRSDGLSQPLRSNNTLGAMQPQNSKDQGKLLQKFRQLRQWQQQQQESMTKQQQEHMETLKMQQEKLQILYAKAANNGIITTKVLTESQSPSAQDNKNFNKCQRFTASQLMHGQIRPGTGGAQFNPAFRTVSGLAGGNVNGRPVQPLLMSPQHFISSTTGSGFSRESYPSPVQASPQYAISPYSWSPNDQPMPGNSPGLSQTGKAPAPFVVNNRLFPREMEPELPGQAEIAVYQESVELHSDLDSQSDVQSEFDTLSGVYPLQDAESHVDSDDGDLKHLPDQELSDEEISDDESEGNLLETVIEIKPQEKESKCVTPEQAKIEDDRPITPGIGLSSAATFEELLEKQLKLEEKEAKSPSPVKPQKTFLRKGQGLARFRMKPQPKPHTKPSVETKKPGTGLSLTQAKPQLVTKRESIVSNETTKATSRPSAAVSKVTRKVAGKSSPANASVIASPEVSSPQPFGTSTLASRVIGPFSGALSGALTKTTLARASSPTLSPMRLGVHSSIDTSFQRMKLQWENNEKVEEDELEEFEMLEQAAANASFSSNCSTVVRILEKGKTQKDGGSQTSIKPSTQGYKESKKDAAVGHGGILSPVDTGYASSESRVPGGTTSHANTVIDREEEHPDDNQLSEDELGDEDVTLHEMSLDSAIEDGELISKNLHSQVVRLHDAAAFTTEKVTTATQKSPPSPPLSSMTSSEDFDDEEAWGEIKSQAGWPGTESEPDSDDSESTVMDVHDIISSTPPPLRRPRGDHVDSAGNEAAVTSTPPTSSLVTKLFPQLKPKPKVSEEKKPSTSIEEAPAPAIETESGPSRAVQDKLLELEQEISKFRQENKALAKIREEREQGLIRLQDEITSFEKQKSEELERLEKFREEETQKLRREKKVFEKYQKAARANPDKKEREEIESLKAQLSELQEEMKRRDSRWSAASARYRNRIEALEEQNKELQEEVKLLEKYRLDLWRTEQDKAGNGENSGKETRPRKEKQRKTARPSEQPEYQGVSRHPASDRPQPRLPVVMETLSSPPVQSHSNSLDRMNNSGSDVNNNSEGGVSGKSPVKSDVTATRISPLLPPTHTPNSGPLEENPAASSPSGPPAKQRRNVRFVANPDLAHAHEATVEEIRAHEIAHPDGKVEQVQPDGSRVILFANGTRREISSDGKTVIVTFFNGDIKQVMPDQRVVYYYSEAQTTHTTYPDGLEVLQFPNNQIEKHYTDGTKEIIFPDQTVKYLHTNGSEECVFPDGTVQRLSHDGERTIEFPNGQREIHTKFYKKREYPNGTVKTVFQDGRTETRYSNGRLRVRDQEGRVIMDTADQTVR
ncbi:centromere protein J isoform X2 [Nematostella vectensis]|uniref:centromere protein J isoform X2 n=1 Tax=Nematostella vectensis TaxID=45351 RepID=UPI0020777141|nr:centromere protein J isoform X2 [Nematostella vectensis]